MSPPPDHPEFKPPKRGNRKVKNPSGQGYGWIDKKGRVWVWDPKMHGGEGWIIINPDGGHSHAYPGGRIRDHMNMDICTEYISIFPEESFLSDLTLTTFPSNGGGGGAILVCVIALSAMAGLEMRKNVL